MSRFAGVLMVTVTLMGSLSATAQQSTADTAIVRQFFPAALNAEVDAEKPVRAFEFTRADLDGTGQPDYIVVVYYNGIHDALRILRVRNGVGSVAYDPDILPPLGYFQGHVTLVDLDGDGRPEIVLTIPTERGSTDWVLKWSNGALAIVSPVKRNHAGRPSTLLGPVTLLDIDGDGIPEVLDYTRTSGSSQYVIYKFAAGRLAPSVNRVYLAKRLVRTSGEPDDFDMGLHVDAPGVYTLQIVNGDAQAQNRVSSAEVDLGDKVIAPESAFKKGTRVMTYSVTLAGENEIFVELRSAPGSELTIVITKAP